MATEDTDPDKSGRDGRWHAPAAGRNRQPILDVLRRVMPRPGVVLDIAAGSGQHTAWFAPEFPRHRWAPSDLDPAALVGIDAWTGDAGVENILPARRLDAAAADWPVADIAADLVAIVNINMLHIAPWQAALGLFAGAGRLLLPDGMLYLYGPYLRGGRPASDSDAAFDRSLRAQDPSWGLRDVDAVVAAAAGRNLRLTHQVDMPAGNLSLVFTPAAQGGS